MPLPRQKPKLPAQKKKIIKRPKFGSDKFTVVTGPDGMPRQLGKSQPKMKKPGIA